MWIVHWSGQDVIACDEHRDKLINLARVLGFAVSCTPVPDDAATYICTNCVKERRNDRT